MSVAPNEVFNSTQSIDFEVAFSALIATTVTLLPQTMGNLSVIPIFLGVGLLVLTLIRKMLDITGEDELYYLNFTMYFVGLFSTISIIYIFYSVSYLLGLYTPFEFHTLDIMFGITIFVVFSVIYFHLFITKDFPDFVYFSVKQKKQQNQDTKAGRLIGNKLLNYSENLITELPINLISDNLKQELSLENSKKSYNISIKYLGLKLIVISAIIIAVMHILDSNIVRIIVASLASLLILIVPIQMWYLRYGRAKPGQIFGKKFYISVWIISFIFLLLGLQ